ncbi:hypothetical protein LR48_Vigan01g236400 [Vigna angularis]|uniref:Aminotransferase-like plant mobile domain-containing protein n=1 Tax=Phaseolus angularis TaxID=3914 RepID=A0A0L9TQE4_PHAAN|nr:hypothetical protein LR48_Vigan01g236400 [Vigna angularis]
MARTRGASFSSRGESSRGESSSQGEARRRSTVSACRSRAAPIQDDPIAEERAVEEQTYEAYETHGPRDGSLLTHYVQHVAYAISQGRNAFTAPNDDDDEEEHVDVHDIQEDVGGFPGGPRDGSLLTHYVQHVAYAISQGRSWIYEHFPSMGRRRLVASYDDTTPRAMSGVVWHPYEGHRGIRPFFGICMYSGWIRIGDTLCRHLPERVLRQFGFQQDIPRSPTTVPNADVVVIDHMWLHFRAHVVSNVRHASSPSDCVDGYIQWFRRVSHPYIIVAADDARPTLAPRQRPDVPREARSHRRSSPPSPSGALARFRRMARMLQSLISCRHVTEGTVAHQVSVDLLQIANEGIDEYSTTRREQRHVRGRRSTSN